jgi:general secretion pathway protein J
MAAASVNDRPAGFTLLELIVARVVLGFLLIALNAGSRAGFALWNAQARRAGETAELDATGRVLRTILTGLPILPVTASENIPQAIAFKGQSDHLDLVAELPTGLGLRLRADTTLRLSAGRLVLDWTPHRHEQTAGPADAATETELIRGVDHLDLAYIGTPVPGQAAEFWRGQWDGPALPRLIRIRLRFAKGDRRHWPDLIVAPQLAPP